MSKFTILGGFPKKGMGGHVVLVDTEEQVVEVKSQGHPHVVVTVDMKSEAMSLLKQGYMAYEKIGDATLGEPLTDANALAQDKDYLFLLPIAGG